MFDRHVLPERDYSSAPPLAGAAWVIETVRPAAIMVPVLEVVRVLGATVNVTAPLPAPEPLTVIHGTELAELQLQLDVVVTVTVPVPPPDATDTLAGDTV